MKSLNLPNKAVTSWLIKIRLTFGQPWQIIIKQFFTTNTSVCIIELRVNLWHIGSGCSRFWVLLRSSKFCVSLKSLPRPRVIWITVGVPYRIFHGPLEELLNQRGSKWNLGKKLATPELFFLNHLSALDLCKNMHSKISARPAHNVP